jgi:uncharacterized membrane protein
MPKIEMSIVINRPLEEVFAFMGNFENNPKWQSSSVEVKKISEGPVGVGTAYQAVITILGRRINSEQVITEYQPNRLVARKSTSGPFPFETQVRFERAEGGTRVTGDINGEPRGFFKMADPLLERAIKRQFDSDLANLKDMMEAGAI